jgi:hypothetical protein
MRAVDAFEQGGGKAMMKEDTFFCTMAHLNTIHHLECGLPIWSCSRRQSSCGYSTAWRATLAEPPSENGARSQSKRGWACAISFGFEKEEGTRSASYSHPGLPSKHLAIG